MTDSVQPDSSAGLSAGQILREARIQQGLAVDVLAAQIKVAPGKITALEEGRLDQLLDANFARALAMTVCRALKIDPVPVLAALPAAKAMPLVSDKPALNQPFKESSRSANLSFDGGWHLDLKSFLRPQWLAPLGLLLVALIIYLLPDSIQWPHLGAPTAASAASTPAMPASVPLVSAASAPDAVASESQGASAPMAEPVASATESVAVPSAPAPVPTPAASAVVTGNAATAAPLVLLAKDPAWVEVKDAQGQKLISRRITAGETVGIDGQAPLHLLVGNAMGMQVSFRGQTVDLTPYTRNNVARIELK